MYNIIVRLSDYQSLCITQANGHGVPAERFKNTGFML
jgi:hypothetical protein